MGTEAEWEQGYVAHAMEVGAGGWPSGVAERRSPQLIRVPFMYRNIHIGSSRFRCDERSSDRN